MDSDSSMDARTTGGRSAQRAASHPRRPPAHLSVSLRHSPPQESPNVYQKDRTSIGTTSPSPTVPRSDRANPPSVSPKLRTHKQSSGESSDAGKWFENSNNNPTHNPSFVDNEPPFFLHNSSSSETPPHILEQQAALLNMHSRAIPYRPVGAQLAAEGSGSDDYRSVIDDLTVANKRLRQKLRKYEKLYDAHLQEDKLFEVRFHGLPDDKKKELEETLRKFAISLSDSPSSDSVPSTFVPPALNKNPASSHTSTRFAESGYASMSASGQNSVSVPSGTLANTKKASNSPLDRHHRTVQSYLHDITAGFIGKPLPMTEKAKKKLVVRRLEQLFAGKLRASEGYPQPAQQQEVAQSAARADRAAQKASGQHARKEGIREARIMSQDEQPGANDGTLPNLLHYPPSVKTLAYDSSSSGSPDQRPTRPLDLDPYRAQFPLENMEYIRHLGFTPPDMISGAAPQDGHGWIYLNLLVNMAQLHTINVTPDIVKNAVADYSDKFELSHDGRKIRWKGGHDITRHSSDGSPEQLSSTDVSDEAQRQGKQKLQLGRTGSGANMDPAHRAQRLSRLEKERERNNFAYSPLFFHSAKADDDDEFDLDLDSSGYSPIPVNVTGNSSGLESFPITSPPWKRRDTGPIIFYNNAKFCTDLSGDRRGATSTTPVVYESITSHPIGTRTATSKPAKHTTDRDEAKGPLCAPSSHFEDSMDLDLSGSGDDSVNFASEVTENGDGPRTEPARIDFEISGLGGVQSVDNFAVDVRLRKKRVDHQYGPAPARRGISKPKLYSHKIVEALKQQGALSPQHFGGCGQSLVAEEIISMSHEKLPNSIPPPPSMLPFESFSGDADSDDDSDVSSEASDESSQVALELRNAPQLLNVSPMHDASEESSDEEEDDESDSVDFLATARAIDPTTIYAREREYDSNLAERLAEEIPPGSSAATGAGGSGFNSPASVAAIKGVEPVQMPPPSDNGHHLLSKNLKRARTSDNIATLHPGKAPKLD